MMRKLLPIGAAIGFAVFLIYASYRSGLFFDRYWYKPHLLLYVAFLAWMLAAFFRRSRFAPLQWHTLLPFGMGALYFLHLSVPTESVQGTIEQAMRWISYGSFLVLFAAFSRQSASRVLLHYAFAAVGLFVGFGAFLGMYGVIDFKDIVQVTQDERLSSLGMRLAGFFQYANTFGAVMGAFLLYHLVHVARLGAGSGFRSTASAMLHIGPLIPYGTAIMLTESRGAWLSLALGWLLGFALLRSEQRMRFTVYSAVTGCMAAIAYGGIVRDYAQGAQHPGATDLILFTVAGTAAMLGLRAAANRLLLHRIAGANSARLLGLSAILAAAGAIGIMLLVPGTASDRITGNYDTAASRTLFYKDALVMFRDAPLFGYGGDSWKILFTSYERGPYVGSEVHSGYLEVLLDLGIVGACFFAAMLIIWALRLWRMNRLALPPLALLFAHSVIDFDMSYGFFWLIALWLIGSGIADGEKENEGLAAITAEPAQRLARRSILSYATHALAILAVVAGGWFALHGELSRTELAEGKAAKDDPDLVRHLNAAVRLYPYDSTVRLQLAKRLSPNDARFVLEDGLAFEPRNVKLRWELGQTYAALGQMGKAAEWMGAAVQADRYDKEKQTQFIETLTQAAERLLSTGKPQLARELAEQAIKAYQSYADLALTVERANDTPNGKKFGMTVAAKLAAAQSMHIIGRYEDARHLFADVAKDGDEEQRELASYFLNIYSS